MTITTRNTDINKSSLHQTKDFSLNTRRYEEFFEKIDLVDVLNNVNFYSMEHSCS